MRVSEMVMEALAEDARENGHFDKESFYQFMPEEAPADVHDAWVLYDRIVYGKEEINLDRDRRTPQAVSPPAA